MPATKENAADYDYVIALVHERSRIRLHDGKHALIRARLGKRMRCHGYETFGDYCDFLRHGADETEISQLVDALATNFTGFLREPDHLKSALRERVRFEKINLLGNYRFDRKFEAIFCRNVMIYFDRATQQELIARLVPFLVPGGYLFTGHSESLNGLSTGLQCLRPSVYRKA